MSLINWEFSFKGNILGFEYLDKFTLNLVPNTGFYQLNSIEDPNIQFILVNPFDWFQHYELKLDKHILESIHLSAAEDAIVMNIVTIKSHFPDSTVNCIAPLIMNVDSGLATQYVIQDTRLYSNHTPLLMNESVKGGNLNVSTD